LNEAASALSLYGDSIANFPLKANLSTIPLNNIKRCEYTFMLAYIIYLISGFLKAQTSYSQ
jgi:hypothetical protein